MSSPCDDHFLESHQYLESFKVWTRHTAREKCDTRIMGVKIPSETLAITNGHFMCNVVVHSKGKEREPSPYQFVQFSIKRIENALSVKHKILEGCKLFSFEILEPESETNYG